MADCSDILQVFSESCELTNNQTLYVELWMALIISAFAILTAVILYRKENDREREDKDDQEISNLQHKLELLKLELQSKEMENLSRIQYDLIKEMKPIIEKQGKKIDEQNVQVYYERTAILHLMMDELLRPRTSFHIIQNRPPRNINEMNDSDKYDNDGIFESMQSLMTILRANDWWIGEISTSIRKLHGQILEYAREWYYVEKEYDPAGVRKLGDVQELIDAINTAISKLMMRQRELKNNSSII